MLRWQPQRMPTHARASLESNSRLTPTLSRARTLTCANVPTSGLTSYLGWSGRDHTCHKADVPKCNCAKPTPHRVLHHPSSFSQPTATDERRLHGCSSWVVNDSNWPRLGPDRRRLRPGVAQQAARDLTVASLRRCLRFESAGEGGGSERSPWRWSWAWPRCC